MSIVNLRPATRIYPPSRRDSYRLKALAFCLLSLLLSACGQDDDGFPAAQSFQPPEASALAISPSAQVKTRLSAQYQYRDPAQRPEGESIISWYLNDIERAVGNSFTPTRGDEASWVYFCVIPKAAHGNHDTGSRVCSEAGLIVPAQGHAPEAQEVKIASNLQPGASAQASYLYFDLDDDPEGQSRTLWRLDGQALGSGMSIKLPENSEAAKLSFCVTPIASTGEPKEGEQRCEQAVIVGDYAPPQATEVGIAPAPAASTLLRGKYQYGDKQSRPEADSFHVWKIDDVQYATGDTLKLPASEEGKRLSFCVTPIAAYGVNATGVEACSVPAVIAPKSGSAPVASGVSIATPLQPGHAASASYLYSDADGDVEGNSLILWQINGVPAGSDLSISLPVDSEAKTLTFCVTPVAQTGTPKQGARVCHSQTIAGSYTPPVAGNLTIAPSAVTGSLLSGSYDYSDSQARPEGGSILSWKLGATVFATGASVTLPNSEEGKHLSFCVTPIAAYGVNDTGVEACSAPAVIAPKPGSAPLASQVAIATPLQPGHAASASYLYSDADGDVEGNSLILWQIDGVPAGSDLSITLPADSEAKALTFCVTPVAQTGTPKQGARVCHSQTIIGSYTPPEADNVAIAPSAMTGSLLSGSYDYSDSQARPEGTSTLIWKLDGADYATGTTVTLPASEEGKDLSFCVIPVAAYGSNRTGAEECSKTANIAPKPGVAPTAVKLRWDAFAKAGVLLSVSYDFADADGDNEGVSLFSWRLDGTEVSQSIDYTPPAGSDGKRLEYCVTPVAVSGAPKIGAETCIATDIAAILVTGELKLGEPLSLAVKGYTDLGVSWKSTNPGERKLRSTSSTGYTLARTPSTEHALRLVGFDIEICVTTAEEGELCRLASQYPTSEVTGGLPTALDAGNNIVSRAVAPMDYLEITLGAVTKRLHRPLSVVESVLLNAKIPAAPLHDDHIAEPSSNLFWGKYTWANADAFCRARGMTLAVEGVTDISDPFGLKQFFDHSASLFPEFSSAYVTFAMGWGSDSDYYWSSSDIGGGTHRDLYMVSGAPSTLGDATAEYAACVETLPSR